MSCSIIYLLLFRTFTDPSKIFHHNDINLKWTFCLGKLEVDFAEEFAHGGNIYYWIFTFILYNIGAQNTTMLT
jgi:hypothetical protein